MGWQKIKEKLLDQIVALVVGLVTGLCLVIWKAVPAEAWAQLGSAIPKRALAALIALLLIALGGTLAYIFSLRRTRKQIEGRAGAVQTKIDTLTARVAELASKLQEAEIENRRLERQVEEYTYKLDDIPAAILRMLSVPKFVGAAETIALTAQLPQVVVEFHLEELERLGYVESGYYEGEVGAYSLTQKGRRYVLQEGLIKPGLPTPES